MIRRTLFQMVPVAALLLASIAAPTRAQTPEILFDHNHTFGEVVEYLEARGCFFIRASLYEGLGENLCWRVNTSGWTEGTAASRSGSERSSPGNDG